LQRKLSFPQPVEKFLSAARQRPSFNQETTMSISATIGRSVIALAMAVTPLSAIGWGASGVAFAKSGNGNGNGNSGGGNGNGNSGNHGGGASSGKGKSDNAHSSKSSTDHRSTLESFFTSHGKKSDKANKFDKSTKTQTKNQAASAAGLNSLNRNYHAYINSSDPRMTAISAYVMAYAEFEAENGPDAIPTDPALSDDALRDALESFTKGGVVTDATLDRAKDILGVGPAVGKIDQIRDTLPQTTPDTTSETTTTTTTTTVTTETTVPIVDTVN
jgi:hypothetical protein